jgi:hypothetical protein
MWMAIVAVILIVTLIGIVIGTGIWIGIAPEIRVDAAVFGSPAERVANGPKMRRIP